MSELTVAGGRTAPLGDPGVRARQAASGIGLRRSLLLMLAGIWLLDGMLQYQPFMYTKAFGQMLAATAAGNPRMIARPITWDATLIEHHLVLLNTTFATIQVLLGLGIAFRPTVRVALAASIAWSLGVWWFGEGLGGVLNGGASPLNGAPGAVILYALAAVVLWPSGRPLSPPSAPAASAPAPFTAARAVGTHVARALWLALWLSLAYFALTPANRSPRAIRGMISGMANGNPGWLSALLRDAASLVGARGLAASIALAATFAVIAIGVFLPPAAARVTLVLAIVMALVLWLFAEAFGGILAGGGTDPNSGPLLVLLALAYWPLRADSPDAAAVMDAGGSAAR